MFPERYRSEYKSTADFCQSIFLKTDSLAKHFKCSAEMLLPIVFPECIRFSVFRDRIETAALETFYIDFGQGFADFSIGRFQMKPSFAEHIENLVRNDTNNFRDFKFIIYYLNQGNEKMVRAARLYRLKSLDWQLYYLCCFYRIVEMKFAKRKFNSNTEKICFYATAYNVGFWRDQNVIEYWENINHFPSGKIDNINNYPYGKIAGEYYDHSRKN
jgi:hypothetical protein